MRRQLTGVIGVSALFCVEERDGREALPSMPREHCYQTRVDPPGEGEHDGGDLGMLHAFPHGVSDRFLQDAPSPDSLRGEGLLFCGTWIEMKGVNYLVEAFTRLVDAGGGTRLTVLGGGVPDADILAAFPNRVRTHVRVIARVAEDEVMRLYRTHDALVLPSTYEGFGMVILEAMSQGLPVIATPVGCIPGLIARGAPCVTVPLRDASALAEAMSHLLSNADERRRLSEGARAAVATFSWRNTALATLDVYERTAAARAAA